MEVKKVLLKTYDELKRLVKAKEIDLLHVSDSGEWTSYGVGKNPQTVKTVWFEEYGQEFLVVDHPNPISKEAYEQLKPLFKDSQDGSTSI